MPRAVLDTNILISGTFWRGASHEVIRAAEKGLFEPITSPEIFREYVTSIGEPEFREKIRKKTLLVLRTQRHIWRLCEHIDPVKAILLLADENDLHLFGCALAARATHLVTNDKIVLAVKEWRGIAVVTPEEFLNILSCTPARSTP